MVDQEKAQAAIKMLLEAIGEDPNRPGLIETPKRVAQMYQEILAGYEDNPQTHLAKTFEVENNDVVIEREIPGSGCFLSADHHTCGTSCHYEIQILHG